MSSIKTIYHLSDIHIPLNSRIREYAKVFESVYNTISRDTKDAVIVITGDLINTKAALSPEMVYMAVSFLTRLGEICPVYLIAGNHDGILQSKSRLDAITPLAKALDNKNITYWRNTGVYTVDNIDFIVDSLLDDDTIRASDIETDNIKVVCYHNAVNQSVSATGFTFEGQGYKAVEYFDGADIVMLGDIHKFQILQEYDGRGHPAVAYAGSLIQQNYGEELRAHGFIKWDVERRTPAFVEIENEYGYYTLDIEGDTQDVDMNAIPNKPHIRIRHKGVDQVQITELISKIRSIKDLQSVRQICCDPSVATPFTAEKGVWDNIGNVGYQNKLIEQYLRSVNGSVAISTVQKIQALNDTINRQCKVSEKTSGTFWKPLSLEWDNMFSYGRNNKIDFRDMRNVVGFIGENGSGKSAIIDILLFALFDKSSRGATGQDVINNRRKKLYCKLVLQSGEHEYVIERRGERSDAKAEAVKIPVDFYRKNSDGSITTLNGDKRAQTYQNIAKIVGSYESFVATLASLQGNVAGFVYKGQADRKRFVAELLGLDVFETLCDEAKNDSKSIKYDLDRLRSHNYYKVIEDQETKIQFANIELQEADAAKRDKQAKLSKVFTEKENLNRGIIPVNVTHVDCISTRKKIAQNQAVVENKQANIAAFIQQLKETKAALTRLQQAVSKMDNPEALYLQYRQLQKLLHAAEKDMATKSTVLKSTAETLAKLDEVQYDPNCHYCMNNALVKDALQKKQSFNDIRAAVHNAQEAVNDLTQQIKQCGNVEEIKSKYDQIIMEIHKGDKGIAVMQAEIANCESQIVSLSSANVEYQRAVDEFERNLETLENNRRLQTNIDELAEQVKLLQAEIEASTNKMSDAQSAITVCRNVIAAAQEGIAELAAAEEKYELYEKYIDAVGKNGVPYYLIKEAVPALEAETNSILELMTDFSVRFKLSDNEIDAHITYTGEDNDGWPVSLTSGFEKFVISLAVRIALTKISNTSRSNFIVIDEGFGSWDSHHLSMINNVFEYLRSHFDFAIIVSHIDSMRDMMDLTISVAKDKNGMSTLDSVE